MIKCLLPSDTLNTGRFALVLLPFVNTHVVGKLEDGDGTDRSRRVEAYAGGNCYTSYSTGLATLTADTQAEQSTSEYSPQVESFSEKPSLTLRSSREFPIGEEM